MHSNGFVNTCCTQPPIDHELNGVKYLEFWNFSVINHNIEFVTVLMRYLQIKYYRLKLRPFSLIFIHFWPFSHFNLVWLFTMFTDSIPLLWLQVLLIADTVLPLEGFSKPLIADAAINCSIILNQPIFFAICLFFVHLCLINEVPSKKAKLTMYCLDLKGSMNQEVYSRKALYWFW